MCWCELFPFSFVQLKVSQLFQFSFGHEHPVDVGAKHGNARVNTAMIDQISKVSYCASTFFKTTIVEEAARVLVNSTNGHMTRAYIVNSGQSAVLSLWILEPS